MAKRNRPPEREPSPPEEPEPAGGGRPPEEERRDEDLTESSALVIMSASDARRLDESAAEPPPEDLTESSALVIMSASDVSKLDRGAPPPAAAGRRPPRAVPPRPPPPPPRRRAVGPVVLGAALSVALTAAAGYGLHRLSASRLAKERDDAIAERDRVRARAAEREAALDQAIRTERAARDRAIESLRREIETERRALGERAVALEKERADTALAAERGAAAAREAPDAAIAAARKEERDRAARERLDLERLVRENVERYEALLTEAEKRRAADLEVARREAAAEILRREALARKRLDEEKAALEQEKERALALEAERIEARLREQLDADRGGFIRGPGGEPGAEAGGIDLEQVVWRHLNGHLGGSVEYRLRAHFADDPAAPDANRSRNEVIAKLRYEASLLDDHVTVKIVPRLRLDDDRLTYSTQQELDDERTRRPVFTLEEAHVGARFGAFDATLGKQIFAFGTGDLYNPTDVLNPVDFTDLIDSEKIGVFALDASAYPSDETRLRLILIPTFTPARLPIEGERFSLFPKGGVFLPAPPPFGVVGPIELSPHREPDRPPATLQACFRATTSLGGLDLSLTYIAGVNDLPNIEVRPLATPPFARLTPVYDRFHMLGADFATTIDLPIAGEVQVHGEAAGFLTEGGRDDDYVQYVVGFEKNFSDPLLEKEATLVIEYAGESVLAHATREDVIFAASFGRALRSAVLARLTWKPWDRLELLGTAAAILDGPDTFYLRPEARYELGTHTRIAAGFDILGGSRNGFFGRYGADDRFFMNLKLSF